MWTCIRQDRSYTAVGGPGCPACPPRWAGLPPPGPPAYPPSHDGAPTQWAASSTGPGCGRRNSGCCASAEKTGDYINM